MRSRSFFIIVLGLVLSAFMIFAGCSGKGVGGIFGSGSGTTVVSGKVSLSGTISASGKAAQLKMMYSVPTAKPGSKAFAAQAANMTMDGVAKVLNGSLQATALPNAKVDLYDADHPEWLYPVASGVTDANGDYTLSAMAHAADNTGATYKDGDPIPAGKYTLVAYKAGIGKPKVAVQSVVKAFDGPVSVDFEVLPSDVAPSVITMFGVQKNKDGTQTWGGAGTTLPATAALQITFSMPMVRESLQAIQIESLSGNGHVPAGKWTLSADWLTATYYPDSGEQFTAGEEYTVTIFGNDDTQNLHVTNVYGNPIDNTAVGTFTATAPDTLSPTIQWNRPTVVEMGSPVDVTQSFRIESNEMLDVNGITLEGQPSIGAKPGVIFLGKNSSDMYVYEFVLGEPLVLNQSYSLKVYGGKDLSGNPINVLTGSIRTNDAADTPGIDPNATPDTQNLQAKVKSVFGRWVGSFNDRSLAQFQSLMSGDFYMEYDTSHGIDSNTDLNRDGRYSFAEFSSMMAKQAFVQWDYCGTTITGNIIGFINVVAVSDTADFEFSLTATNKISSQSCGESAPKDHFYATLKYMNGAWRIVRASQGIDTRSKSISNPGVLTTDLTEIQWPYTYLNSSSVSDGGQLHDVPLIPLEKNAAKSELKYSWDAVPGVSSYVLIVMDARKPGLGRAVAFPVTQTSAASDEGWVQDLHGIDVSSKFGLQTSGNATGNPGPVDFIQYLDGGRYYWELIGFGTIANTDVAQKSANELLKDIAYTSALKSFTVPGTYKDLYIEVRPGSLLTSAPITFSEMLGGYDVGSAYRATLSIRTPNIVASTASHINVQGSSYGQYSEPFDANGLSTATIVLFKGWNWVSVCDEGDNTKSPPAPQLCKSFGILTSGGIPPVIGIWDVTDDTGNVLSGDAWNFYNATSGATNVTIEGAVSDSSVTNLYFNLWNQSGAHSYTSVPVTVQNGVGMFTITTDIYKGNNWIGISGSGANSSYYTNVGIYTDTGAVWIPPISVTGITTAKLTKDYGYSADWDASSDSDNIVSIQGKFKNPQSGNYWISNDNGYSYGQIVVNADGTFSIDNITLYNGWNYVSISDNGNADWYGVNIYTSNGVPVIRTTINTINNQTYNQSGSYQTSACYLTLQGTAIAGPVSVNWSGYDGVNSYYESQSVQADDSNSFTAMVAVVGGANSYNYINVYNQNGKGTSVSVTTSGQCSYTALSPSITAVSDLSGNVLTTDASGYYQAGSNTSIKISGIDTRPGWPITASFYVCGNYKLYTGTTSMTANAGGTYDWTIAAPAYDGYGYYSIQDGGHSNLSISVYSTSGVLAPSPLSLSVTGGTNTYIGSCGSSNWDVTAGGTGVSTITITGTTTSPDGTGTIRLVTGGTAQFTIAGGAFTISGVKVYDGWNYFQIYDTKSNNAQLNVLTANGIAKPQYIKITDPTMNALVSAGTVTVQGSILDPEGLGYKPSYLYGYLYDGQSGTFQRYSTDLYEQQSYGYGAITVSGGTFSFTGSINQTSTYTEIYVYGSDYTLGVSHGDDIYVNTGGTWQENYYKTGTRRNKTSDGASLPGLFFLRDLNIHNANQ